MIAAASLNDTPPSDDIDVTSDNRLAHAVGARLGEVVAAWQSRGLNSGAPELLVAVVHTASRVRFVAAATHREELLRQLCGYVRSRAGDELWADDAARLYQLLSAGDSDAAVVHYFATVGRRWDEEWLVTAAVASTPPTVKQ